MSILPPRKENFEKTSSTFQKALNKSERITEMYRKALIKRKIYAQACSIFITKLKEEGRVTKEELMEYFKPKKQK